MTKQIQTKSVQRDANILPHVSFPSVRKIHFFTMPIVSNQNPSQKSRPKWEGPENAKGFFSPAESLAVSASIHRIFATPDAGLKSIMLLLCSSYFIDPFLPLFSKKREAVMSHGTA